MKHNYCLFILCLSLLSFSTHAQSTIQHRITGGLINSTLHLDTEQELEVLPRGAIGPSLSSTSPNLASEGVGFSLGYQGQFHHRWELAVRANYMGRTIEDNAENFASRSSITPELLDKLQHTRSYRGLWFEGLMFWRVIGPYSRADIQLGTGVSYAYLHYDYLLGYFLDLNRGDFDSIRFAEERKTVWGIPIHFQVQYPVSPEVKIGFNAHLNPHFDGTLGTGVMLFGAYRW
ncbi:MAG: hypothetical protein AAFO03_15430 [Bacteroidota bacterium]